MVKEGWDWYVGPRMVTTTCFWGAGGVKVGLAPIHFSHQDCVSLDWSKQFTASQPFHSLTNSISNGFARSRFEFILHNKSHTPTFESWVVTTLPTPVPYSPFQGGACLDWFSHFIAPQPFQSIIISMMNGWRRLRLACGLENGHHNLFLRCGRGQSWLYTYPLFAPRLCEFGLVRAIHGISTLPFSDQ